MGVAFEEGNNSAGGVQYDGSISSGAAGAVGVRVHRIKHLLCWLQTELTKPFALAYNVVELEGRNAAAVGGSGS